MVRLVALCVVTVFFCLGAECGGIWKPPSPPPPQCMDGIDNDGDGFIDYPEDAGCSDANDSSELPKCSDKFLNEENAYAEEWALIQQAEADIGDYDTDSEQGWIDLAERYWELKQCDPN